MREWRFLGDGLVHDIEDWGDRSLRGRAKEASLESHRRLRDNANPVSWKAPDGVVHQTEVMMNPVWGDDRLTVCKMIKLNIEPQQSYTALHLHPSKEAVTCLLCLAS